MCGIAGAAWPDSGRAPTDGGLAVVVPEFRAGLGTPDHRPSRRSGFEAQVPPGIVPMVTAQSAKSRHAAARHPEPFPGAGAGVAPGSVRGDPGTPDAAIFAGLVPVG